jgi:hydroxymethylbilane synthase
MSLRLGTRNSALARRQAEWVALQLKGLGADVELIPVVTQGDRRQQPALGTIGGEGLFTKEIERELIEGRIDLAVHSLKDLPTTQPPELCLTAVPSRAPVGDVLVSLKYASLEQLPDRAIVGTGSVRRRAQLLRVRPDLRVAEIRGNVDTRLRKLEAGDYDALILAEAGLTRLGLVDRVTQRLPLPIFLPAIGQGALGLETRKNDSATRERVAPLGDWASHAAVLAERAMLAALQGGCLAPVAAIAVLEYGVLKLMGRVISYDGTQVLDSSLVESLPNNMAEGEAVAVALGHRVAEALLAQGAAKLIDAARQVSPNA